MLLKRPVESLNPVSYTHLDVYKRQTGMTPAKLVFGREIRLPGDLMFGSPETQSQEPKNYSSQLENQLRGMNHLVRGRLKIASDKMKTGYDIRSNCVGFQEGDQVWLFNPKRRRGRFSLTGKDPTL